jgi:Zeta toxin
VGVPDAARRAVLAGGLRGADKVATLSRAGIDPSAYLPISVDRILAELAARSLIPVVSGLSPLDSADLVHTEAQHIGKRLAASSIADGRNLLLDITMGSKPSVESWLVNLGLARYTVEILITPVSARDAARWASEEHQRGYHEYLSGRGPGGRYVPADSIRAAAAMAEILAASDWDSILRNVAGGPRIAFPAVRFSGWHASTSAAR